MTNTELDYLSAFRSYWDAPLELPSEEGPAPEDDGTQVFSPSLRLIFPEPPAVSGEAQPSLDSLLAAPEQPVRLWRRRAQGYDQRDSADRGCRLLRRLSFRGSDELVLRLGLIPMQAEERDILELINAL